MAAPLPDAEAVCRNLARELKADMPEGWGFSLFMFTYGGDGHMTYISSAQREDMIAAITEWLVKVQLERPEA